MDNVNSSPISFPWLPTDIIDVSLLSPTIQHHDEWQPCVFPPEDMTFSTPPTPIPSPHPVLPIDFSVLISKFSAEDCNTPDSEQRTPHFCPVLQKSDDTLPTGKRIPRYRLYDSPSYPLNAGFLKNSADPRETMQHSPPDKPTSLSTLTASDTNEENDPVRRNRTLRTSDPHQYASRPRGPRPMKGAQSALAALDGKGAERLIKELRERMDHSCSSSNSSSSSRPLFRSSLARARRSVRSKLSRR